MFFGIKTLIIGDFLLKEPIKSHQNGFEVSIFIEDGVYKISIIKSIDDKSPLSLKYRLSNGTSTIVVPEETAYLNYIKLLQNIEAMGAYNYNITKIYYNEHLELTWYLEDPNSKNLSVVCSVRREFKPRSKKVLSQANLSSILLLNKLIPDSNIPYSYYREAANYLHNNEYRLAYLHYYMIVEFCFANGKYGIKDQVNEYMKNTELCFVVLDILDLLQNNDPKLMSMIKSDVEKHFKLFTLKNIFKYLFQYRGVLAHGSSISAKYVFDDSDLRPTTIFISEICLLICGNMQVYCMSSSKTKKDRILKRFEELRNKLGISLE